MKLRAMSLIIVGVTIVLLSATLWMRGAFAASASLQRPDAPPGSAGTWHEVFSDAFGGTRLNTSVWNTCYWWANGPDGCAGANGELERYLARNVSVHDHLLDLVALRQSVRVDGQTYPYTSGMVTTEGTFSFRYGYMEARLKIPAGQGYWPAFWTLAQDHTRPTELDNLEILGNDPHTIYMGVYYQTAQGTTNHAGGMWRGPDFAADFHTIGVDWEPDHITWYIDGVARQTQTDPAKIPQRALYLILNLAVGGTWPGAPDSTTTFPGHLLVNWVRVWQHSTGAQATSVATATATPTELPPASPTATTELPPASPTATDANGGTTPSAAFPWNNCATTSEAGGVRGNFDTYGDSYAAHALAAAGLPPGAMLNNGGVWYRWPAALPGTPDNYLAAGQVISVTPGARAIRLGLLGAASGSAAEGMATLTFADGSTQSVRLSFSDWTLNDGKTLLTQGNSIVATMPVRMTPSGIESKPTMVFAMVIQLPVGKTLVSVTLPTHVQGGLLHIFAIGTDGMAP